jgi:hypothetical protein
MAFEEDLFRPAPTSNRDAISRVKAWTAACLQLDEHDTVRVTELRCHEPGCPPLETGIAVMRLDQPTVQAKIHRPAASLNAEDVRAACSALRLPTTTTTETPQ